MFSPLWTTLYNLMAVGDLRITDAQGVTRFFGDGSGERVSARLTDRPVEWELALYPTLTLGEAYMNGRLVMTEGGVYDLIALLDRNVYALSRPRPLWLRVGSRWRYLTRLLHQINTLGRAKRNAASHYDHPGALYELFLDSDRQYSCGYFADPDASLEEAQLAKKRRLAAKLRLGEGLKVLDIGSGWGGLSFYLADVARAAVTGVTLSTEQLRVSQERARQLDLGGQVNFLLEDYRKVQGVFDRVVSVGMLEHVGVAHLRRYFTRIRELLASDGCAVVHSIGRSEGPGATNPFIAKYIFPGGYIPALSEAFAAIERSGLYVTDVEIWRLHYALTLRRWRERFMAARDKAVEFMGERFCRMWEFYLAGSESAFRHEGLTVFQVQLAKNFDATPSTRDYMFTEERRLREAGDLNSDSEPRKRMRIVDGGA
jgi:cyclopropane-fatty-acyl-phospholipid synthase